MPMGFVRYAQIGCRDDPQRAVPQNFWLPETQLCQKLRAGTALYNQGVLYTVYGALYLRM